LHGANQPALPPQGAVHPERLRKQQPKGAASRHRLSRAITVLQIYRRTL
jgi:hypothetical protein